MAERLGQGDRRVFLAVNATSVQVTFVAREFGKFVYVPDEVCGRYSLYQQEVWLLLAKKIQRVRGGRDVVGRVGVSHGQWEARWRGGVSRAPIAGQR